MRDTMHTMTREEQDRRLAEIKHFGRNLEREHQVRPFAWTAGSTLHGRHEFPITDVHSHGFDHG